MQMVQLKKIYPRKMTPQDGRYLDPAFYWRASFKFKNGMHCPWRAEFVDLPMHFGCFGQFEIDYSAAST
jgi:hypothetical protein